MPGASPMLVAGRYALFDPIARGGMATVHLGRLLGAAGFSRIVAIKRLLPTHAADAELAAAFLDEARLAARIRHAHVVSTVDVVEEGGEIFLVSEYVHGASIATLVKALGDRGERFPPELAARVGAGALRGLHAVHEARAEDGSPLAIVHRDVSPQNVLVGVDGIAKVIDFGIAKANVRSTSTREGQLKGKLAYMPPEQLAGAEVTPASDVYAAGVVLWEMLAGRRLFGAPTEAGMVGAILEGRAPRLVDEAPWVAPSLAAIVERALERDPTRRWPSALEMANALEMEAAPATAESLGAWVARVAAEPLADQAARIARIERGEATVSSADDVTAGHARLALGPSPDDSVVRTATAVDVKPAARPRALFALVGLVLLLGTSAAFFLARGTHASSAATRGEPAPPPSAGSSTSDTPPSSAPPAKHSAAPSAPAPTPVPEADPSSSGSTSRASPAPRAAPPRATVSAVPPSPAPTAGVEPAPPLPACDPPWEVDAQGIRRVKRHCIGR